MARAHYGPWRAGYGHIMLALTQAFLLIALRRLGPEHLPSSTFLLAVCAVAYVGMQMLLSAPFFGGLGPGLLRSVAVDFALLTSAVGALLRLTGRWDRFRQTLTALLGTGALLSVFIWPFTLLGADEGPAAPVATVGVIGVLLWSVAVNGHILSRALDAPFVMGLVLAVGYFLLNYVVIMQLAPAT